MRDDRSMQAAEDDAGLRDLLRSAAPAPPLDAVDWERLHARITARAAPLLAPTRTAWWQVAAGWSARGIPLAAAAAVLLLIAMGVMQQQPVAAPAAAFVTVEEELAGSSAALLVAAGDADDVIDALLFYEEE